jgi:LCP family protein required for cell wall assembly
MPQKLRRIPGNAAVMPKRPGLDVVAAKKAANFPGVGMTLPNYRYDPTDRHPRSGRGTVVKRGRLGRLKQRLTLKRAVIILAILVLLIVGWVGGKFLYNAHKLFGGNIFGILSSTTLRGEDTGRVNILLAGNSADDAGHAGGNLTDSIMVLSLDTKNHKAFMLSIPRDLWVHVPDDGHDKINEAYVVGEDQNFSADGYPAGGMGMLEKIVSQNLGIPIHYYALVNYNALKQAVDSVGGVDFTVKSEDPRGLYDPNIDWTTRGPLVKLTNGTHHLNGQQALDLARARGDAYNSYGFAGSDFTRTEHQRQLLIALKNKSTSAGTLANPAKLSSLSDAVGNNVKTDFKLDEVRRLYDLVKKVDNSGIKSLSLNQADGKSLLASYQSPRGQSALIPARGVDNFSDIQAFVRRQTSSDPVVQESAKVVVLNGTSVNGLAVKWKQKLTGKNFIIDAVGDAKGADQPTTTIIDNSKGKKPSTRAALVKQFGDRVTSQNPYANVYDVDFIIIIGADRTDTTTAAVNSTRS